MEQQSSEDSTRRITGGSRILEWGLTERRNLLQRGTHRQY